ncbi:MAG: CAP domain-containing protein [Anaerolineales bacterium]
MTALTKRADVGRAALTVDPQLTTAAQGHSLDMACNDFFKQRGRRVVDGQTSRKKNAGYASTYYVELIAFGLPGDAMNQWKLDPLQWENVLNSRVTEIGARVCVCERAVLEGYWTVDMGRP